MSPADEVRQLRAEHALALYESIEAVALDVEDPRSQQAALLLKQLRDFGPDPDEDHGSPFAVRGLSWQPARGAAAVASDRLYEGYAE